MRLDRSKKREHEQLGGCILMDRCIVIKCGGYIYIGIGIGMRMYVHKPMCCFLLVLLINSPRTVYFYARRNTHVRFLLWLSIMITCLHWLVYVTLIRIRWHTYQYSIYISTCYIGIYAHTFTLSETCQNLKYSLQCLFTDCCTQSLSI